MHCCFRCRRCHHRIHVLEYPNTGSYKLVGMGRCCVYHYCRYDISKPPASLDLTHYIVFVVTIAVGIQGHPPPVNGVILLESDYKLFGNPSFIDAMTAVSTISLTYAGTPAFFNIVSEMRDPRHYNRALAICQVLVTVIYIVVGTVVYYYCGSHVASPALGSAGVVIKKVSYGFALPGLCVSAILLLHVSFILLIWIWYTFIKTNIHASYLRSMSSFASSEELHT